VRPLGIARAEADCHLQSLEKVQNLRLDIERRMRSSNPAWGPSDEIRQLGK